MFQGLIFVLQHPLNKGKLFSTVLTIFWWKLNQIFLKLPVIISILPDIKCVCYPSSSYGSLIVYTRLPEYDEMTYVQANLKKRSVFVDVGAGLGDYSLIAATQIEQGNIYSFEPNRTAYFQLKENILLNSLTNKVQCFNMAVSHRNGTISFTEEKVSELSRISSVPSNKSQQVASVTLDSFLMKHNINTIDMIKIDVEGAEAFVLKGAERSLQTKRIKQIIIELNPKSAKYGMNHQSALDILSKYNYKFFFFDQGIFKPVTKQKLSAINTTQNIIAKL